MKGTSGTPSELEGCGENTKDMGDTVQLKTQTVHIKSVHTVKKTSLPNVRKVQGGGMVNGQEQVQSVKTCEMGGTSEKGDCSGRNGPDTTSKLCCKVSKFGDGGRLQSNWRN